MCISTFLRLVEIAIDKPLKSDFMNGKQNGKLAWVNLKYEKLYDLCYNYGIKQKSVITELWKILL